VELIDIRYASWIYPTDYIMAAALDRSSSYSAPWITDHSDNLQGEVSARGERFQEERSVYQCTLGESRGFDYETN
jgi:hypothetical protein